MTTDFKAIISSIPGEYVINESKLIIRNESIQSIFHLAESSEALNVLTEKYKFVIPDDFHSFLSQYRKAVLFQHSHFGGGYDILSVEGVVDYWKSYSIDAPYYPIIWSSHSIGSICVNQEQVGSENGYLTWIDSMDPENPIDLNLSFTDWLVKLIECDGKEFWLES
ncbi:MULTISPECIES: SMI1/KNR4 family protein [Brevibacillus]|uniref:SMI1/KNR4 family protein n=1 Tax=Brevibacillus TaxID=55080 RepID=UPI0002A4F3E7|nr:MULTISPECIES: SMI1/KNR4 family protein [Brevibacillus]ELK38994.1 hypothetical protein D478_26734 [Brevibacillus agri BAB-2500]WHX29899.1 SMI1/KNR4 family protein [Brevibacillus agri]